MPTINLVNPAFISRDGAGRPNSGGSVEVFVADGLFTTYATIWADQVKTTELTNPVTLDDAGVIEIWYDVKVDIREKTNTGVLIRDTENIDPNAGDAVVQGFNLAENGSFEVDSDSDGQPDSWTITPYTGSAIAITNDVVTDGIAALEFNTTAAGTGGGTATSAKFPVTEGSTVSVAFSFYATNATTLNTFVINWYDEDDVVSGAATTVTMPASGSVPTSWTNYQEEVTVTAGGTQGEIVLTGISSGGSNRESKAYFDGIKIVNLPNMVTLTGTQSITGVKTMTTPVLNTPTITTPAITTPTITGTPTINAKRAYGVEILDTPYQVLNVTSVTADWTKVDMSGLGGSAATSVTDGAVTLILRCYTTHTSSGASSNSTAYIQKASAALAKDITTQAVKSITTDNTDNDSGSDTSLVYVNVDGSGDFDYHLTSTLSSAQLLNIHLIGYYV